MSENTEIPNGWASVTLGDVGEIVSGGTPSTSMPEYWNGKINWITPSDLSGYVNKYISCGAKSISEAGLVKSSARLIPKGSVLFSSRAPIGYVCIANRKLCTNQGFKSIIPNEAIFNEYLFHFLKSAKRKAEDVASGTTFKEISLSHFSKLQIPLPPLPEQHRIVAKIEELFSSLGKGIESLKTAQQQLKVYRQAVLKWAFEGKLTEEWRNKQKGLASVGSLLQEIKKRRDEYSNASGRKIKIIEELFSEQLCTIVELPESWVWTKLNKITYQITDGTHLRPAYVEKGHPFLSVKNVRPGLIKDSEIRYISKEQHEDYIKRCKPEKGDILYTKVGATYGYAAINTLDYEFSIYVSLCLIKFPQSCILPKYLEYCLNSNLVYKQAQNRIKGIGRPDLHLEEIRDFHIPICAIPEQQAVVAEIESRLSVCDKIEESIEQSLQQSEALRRSILKKAFEGKLVPQNTNDEPASALLERIKAEREQTKVDKKPCQSPFPLSPGGRGCG